MFEGEYQYHIKLKNNDAGKFVILTGDPGRCQHIAKYLDNSEFISSNREYTVYSGYLNDKKVSVVSTGIGGPSAAIAMEELVNVGAGYFIRIGTCGGMQLEVMPGDMVIATGAIRAEGTSREYLPIEFPAVPDIDITQALINSCKALNYKYHAGVIQSKDSFYGEHFPEKKPVSYELLAKWDAWIKGGALASEMECAALFTVAACLKVKAGAVLHVVNNQERDRLGMTNMFDGDTDKAIRAAVAAMKNIITQQI